MIRVLLRWYRRGRRDGAWVLSERSGRRLGEVSVAGRVGLLRRVLRHRARVRRGHAALHALRHSSIRWSRRIPSTDRSRRRSDRLITSLLDLLVRLLVVPSVLLLQRLLIRLPRAVVARKRADTTSVNASPLDLLTLRERLLLALSWLQLPVVLPAEPGLLRVLPPRVHASRMSGGGWRK